MLYKILSILSLSTCLALASPGEHLKKQSPLPPISEVDQSGSEVTLSEVKGDKGTLLVIYRSADW